jgi:hypothetical protein
MHLSRILAATVVACSLTACSATEPDNEPEFHALLDEHWAAATAEKIFFRTDPDAWRMDGTLPEHNAEARARRQQFNEQVSASKISTRTIRSRIGFSGTSGKQSAKAISNPITSFRSPACSVITPISRSRHPIRRFYRQTTMTTT